MFKRALAAVVYVVARVGISVFTFFDDRTMGRAS
jgi:hypothetical protein